MANEAPLNQELQLAGAVFGAVKHGEEPLHFGDLQGEYESLASGAGLVDLSARTRIELRGEDRAKFLHNLCTNEIRKLPSGSGCEAFLADARGHVLGHVFVFCRAEALLLETVPGEEAKLLAHFDRYLIREKVELVGHSADTAELLLAGAQAEALLATLTTAPLPQDRLCHVEADLAGYKVLIARVDFTRSGGFLIVCVQQNAAEIWRVLRAAGARPCGYQAFEMARIEAGFPWYGIDLTEANLPQEAGRDELAISFVKGCYIGQETVARIDALGHVNKMLVGLKFSGDRVPEPGLELTAGGQPAGKTASSCYSPLFQAPLALAYVRRGLTEPGTALESPLGEAEVVRL